MMTVPSVTVSPAERRRAREFARLLEGTRPPVGHELESLVSLATSLRPADIAPRAEFRAALRESLVAEAAARQIAPAGTPKPDPAQAPRHRVRTVVATGVLVSLVGGFGAAAASTHALPGDSLYGLKRGIESAQLRFAHSDLSRGRDLLDQADSRLSEAEALAASEDARSPETQTRIAGAIADLETATRAGADALQASYADTGDVEPLIELDRFVVDQRARLADLSALLNPDLRALLAPLSQLLLTLQPHLDSLVADSSATSGVATGSTSASGQPEGGSISGRPPLIGNAVDVAARINGLTGGDPSTTASGVAVASPGVLGSAGTGSPLPSVVPHVKIPRPAPPTSTLPLPSAAVPSIPVPSAPGLPEPGVPTAPVPGVPLPTPITAPTLPSTNVTPPACIPIPPLPTC